MKKNIGEMFKMMLSGIIFLIVFSQCMLFFISINGTKANLIYKIDIIMFLIKSAIEMNLN